MQDGASGYLYGRTFAISIRSGRARAVSKKTASFGEICEKLSARVTRWTGTTQALMTALAVVVLWLATGPLFGYSNTWQLVINTGTTVITFLMVFLIQRTQNKDALAIHLKLNELVAAMHGASNRLIEVESLSEKELVVLDRHYRELAKLAAHERSLVDSHSIEEARSRHKAQIAPRKT
jgi:low affinity Fe/Cu permease